MHPDHPTESVPAAMAIAADQVPHGLAPRAHRASIDAGPPRGRPAPVTEPVAPFVADGQREGRFGAAADAVPGQGSVVADRGRRAGNSDNDRSAAFAAAHRHSARVRVLRLVLPGIALSALSLYALFASFSFSAGNLSGTIGGIQLRSDKLTMLNPLLEGVTKDDGAYKVRADKAIQNLATPDVIGLEAIDARLREADASEARLVADSGTFRTKEQTLSLRGKITMQAQDGTKAHLTTAEIDMKARTLASDEPVRVELVNGDVEARAMTANIADRKMSFIGDVRVVLQKVADAPHQGRAGGKAALRGTTAGGQP